jgi:hypothetical protein
MTLELNEFNGREQIGDLIYTPWGTIGFCYNTYGIGCSDRTINLGTWHGLGAPELARFEGQQTRVGVVQH